MEPGGIKTDFISRSQQWASHPAYKPKLGNMIEVTTRLDENLPVPEMVATVIYKAAIDRTNKLRYPAEPSAYLLMQRMLLDWIWRSVVEMTLNAQAQA